MSRKSLRNLIIETRVDPCDAATALRYFLSTEIEPQSKSELMSLALSGFCGLLEALNKVERVDNVEDAVASIINTLGVESRGRVPTSLMKAIAEEN